MLLLAPAAGLSEPSVLVILPLSLLRQPLSPWNYAQTFTTGPPSADMEQRLTMESREDPQVEAEA
jgi:hypothetical protein